jgi:hypothetical protein
MASNPTRRLVYYLSAEDSAAWHQGGLAQQQVQQRLWAAYQHMPVREPVDVLHPTGLYAMTLDLRPQVQQARDLTAPLDPWTPTALTPITQALDQPWPRPQDLDVSATAAREVFVLSPAMSAAWARGGPEARRVEQTLDFAARDLPALREATIAFHDGTPAFRLESESPQSLLQTLRAELTALATRVEALQQAAADTPQTRQQGLDMGG